MPTVKKKKESSPDIKDAVSETTEDLHAEVIRLRRENETQADLLHQARLERDVLAATIEVLKKDRGINPEKLTNPEKARVIDALRKCYELKELLRQLNIAKSSYEYAREVAGCTEKYRNLREKAKKIFEESNRTYGYRRIHSEVVKTYGKVSEKVIRGIMKSEMLKVVFVRMKKYCSYCGEVSPAVPNLVMRDFHAESPNQLILSDITEFNIPAGKVYFSPAIDCFDGMPIAWTIGTSPNAELVNAMLDDVIDKLKPDEHPIIHTDRGGHYRWPGWIERMDKAGLKRSMSKKGCCADNSACEGFFGHLKSEMFYGRSWANVSIQEFIEKLNGYIIWYREKRIKETIGYQSPLEYRRGLCLAR